MNTSMTTRIEFIGEGDIDMNKIMAIRDRFYEIYRYWPEKIWLSPRAMRNLSMQIDLLENVKLETLMGMELDVRGGLEENEWSIGKENKTLKVLDA